MFKVILNNIVTTLMGCFAGLPILIPAIKEGNLSEIVAGASIFLLGLFAKDGHK